ncbi:MAG: membrane protein insertase YidC, partial [Pseudomonadota bacterium]
MDNQRLFLYIALLLVLYLLWTSWQQENVVPQVEQEIIQQEYPNADTLQGDIPVPTEASPIDKPPQATNLTNVTKTEYVRVVTDVFDIGISTRGADIHRAKLLTYPVSIQEPDNPLVLFSDVGRTYISQSGLVHDP